MAAAVAKLPAASKSSSSSAAAAPAPVLTYSVNDKCFALHDGSELLYKAKVLASRPGEVEGGPPWYFLHYDGWNKKWDEWVNPIRMKPFTPENVQLAKDIQAAQKKRAREEKERKENKAAGNNASAGGAGKRDSGRPKKKKKVYPDKELEDKLDEAELRIPLTFTLKKQLVLDWENVQKQRLVALPRTPTVMAILNSFQEAKEKLKRGAISDKAVHVVCEGIAKYFDQALPRMLLFRFERLQYLEHFNVDEKAKDKSALRPCELYGAEHLLRLFVKLPSLLVHTNMNAVDLANLQSKLTEFLKFMQRNHSSFFLNEYTDAPESYCVAYKKQLE